MAIQSAKPFAFNATSQRHRRILASVAHAVLAGGLVLASSPVRADDIVPPKVNASTPAGVNIVDGYFAATTTDLEMGTLKLERFALPPAKLPVNDPYFGQGISHNFDIYVSPNFIKAFGPPYPAPAEYHPIVHIGNSASGVYQQSSPTSTTIGAYNQEAYKGILALVGGAYVYTDQTGTIYTFNPNIQAGGSSTVYSQRIDNIQYPDGRKETFSYDTNKLLKMVSDTAGYAIIFDYNSSNDVSAACIFDLARDYVTAASTCATATNKVTYTYTSSLLTSVTDVLGKVTSYTRYGTTYGAPISCVTPPGYTSCKISNGFDGQHRAAVSTLIDGSSWQSDYDITCVPDPDNPDGGGSCVVDVTDPNGKVWHYSFAHSSPTYFTDPNGHATQYHFTGSTYNLSPNYDQTPHGPYLIEADFPEGNKYLAEYNGPFNLISKATTVPKPGSASANAVEYWAYGPCTSPGTLQNCGKPIWKKDALGNETDYVYTSWGGTQSEMQPAPTTGAARPLKLYSYAQKYAYIKNSSGALVAAATPIWTLTSETQCQTVAGSGNGNPVCDTGAPILTTTYQYGADGTADNLLVRGKAVSDGTTTLRTCYGYDAYSRKISETRPRAALSTCP